MFRLNVIVSCILKNNPSPDFTAAFENTVFDDVNFSFRDTLPEDDELNFKNICIIIADDEKVKEISGSEFSFIISVGDSLPKNRLDISAVISPSLQPDLFIFQLKASACGIISSYLYMINRSMLDTTINSFPNLIWYKAIDGSHFNVNDGFCYTVSKDKSDIEDKKHAYIWNVSEDEAYACQESEEITLKEDKTCSFEELVNHPDGLKTMVTYKTPLRTKAGTIIGTAGIALDVTKQREYEAKLHEMAFKDPLTGLSNRRKLYEDASEKYPAGKTICYVDIDYFKSMNDRYGHETGDKILGMVSDGLKREFSEDITARMGGDEFVVVSDPELPDEEITRRISEIEKSCSLSKDEEDIKVRLSVGIYRGDLPIKEAIRKSDELMYVCKRRHHENAQ